MNTDVSIARLEEKVDRILEHIVSQEDHNKIFYAVRDDMLAMKASKRAILWVVGAFGTLTVAVSTAAAAITEIFMHKGGGN